MAYPENILTLDILPLSADTARLVRVYGTAPCVVLPAVLPAPEGGSFAVTELGGIVFPPRPAFYHRPQTIDQLIDDTVERVLALLHIEQAQPQAWRGL